MTRNRKGQFKRSVIPLITLVISTITLLIVLYCGYIIYAESTRVRNESIRESQEKTSTDLLCVYETYQNSDNNTVVYKCNVPNVSDTSKTN